MFERPFDGEDDPRLQVARALTRKEAEAVLEHRGDLIATLAPAGEPLPGKRGRAYLEMKERALAAEARIRELEENLETSEASRISAFNRYTAADLVRIAAEQSLAELKAEAVEIVAEWLRDFGDNEDADSRRMIERSEAFLTKHKGDGK